MLEQRIAEIKRSLPNGVTLVAATKTQPVEVLETARDAGLTLFGENRVQEFTEKYPRLSGVTWHFIGHLQTNKVSKVVGKVALIQSVDSLRLAAEIDKCARGLGIVQEILLEINPAGEPTKSGFRPEDTEAALAQVSGFTGLRAVGLMAMMPKTQNNEDNAVFYLQIRRIYDTIVEKGNRDFRYLSMGMSGDYLTAVRYGANMVRVGSAIFGERDYTGKR